MVKYSLWVGKNNQVTDILWSQKMRAKKFLLYLLATIIGGCIPVVSLHPLYNEDDVVFEKKLVGVWINDSNETWEFKQSNIPAKSYKLLLSGEKIKEGLFSVYLVKLGDKLFLDAYPAKWPGEHQDPNSILWSSTSEFDEFNIFFIPVHTFVRVDSIGPQLKMRLTDDDNMKKLLKQDPNAVRYESVGDWLVLTAPTKELQAFVIKYANDEKLFGNKIVLNRKKISAAEPPGKKDPNDPNQTSKEIRQK